MFHETVLDEVKADKKNNNNNNKKKVKTDKL